jgi:hypothetical protein
MLPGKQEKRNANAKSIQLSPCMMRESQTGPMFRGHQQTKLFQPCQYNSLLHFIVIISFQVAKFHFKFSTSLQILNFTLNFLNSLQKMPMSP